MTPNTSLPEFTLTRTLDAPRDLVWRAWTEPDHLIEWFRPKGITNVADGASFVVREGGQYEFTMISDATGDTYPVRGVFVRLDEPERLEFTWIINGDIDDAAHATVTLTARGEKTDLVFTLRGIDGLEGDTGAYDGWTEALDNLAELVTKQTV